MNVRGAENKRSATRIALLADPHIAADPARILRGVQLTEHLEKVRADVLSIKPLPDHLLIDGDCAMTKGLAGDYAQFHKLIQPLRDARIPMHFLMGNHDDRDVFVRTFAENDGATESLVEQKWVGVLQTPEANWIFLDTLMKVNVVTGELGDDQRRWLDRYLSRNADRPAIVVMHHNPQFEPRSDGKITGVKDTDSLFELLSTHQQVKAVIYGHSHTWRTDRHKSGIHLINLPPVAYVFEEGYPSGWVLAEATEEGICMTLRSLDPDHPQHLEERHLEWR